MFSGRTAKVCSLLSAHTTGSKSSLQGCRLGGEGAPSPLWGTPHSPQLCEGRRRAERARWAVPVWVCRQREDSGACTSRQGSTNPPTPWGQGGSERWGQRRSRPGWEAPRGMLLHRLQAEFKFTTPAPCQRAGAHVGEGKATAGGGSASPLRQAGGAR